MDFRYCRSIVKCLLAGVSLSFISLEKTARCYQNESKSLVVLWVCRWRGWFGLCKLPSVSNSGEPYTWFILRLSQLRNRQEARTEHHLVTSTKFVCVFFFSDWCVNENGRHCLWLVDTFSTPSLQPLCEIW